jgi:hypothetical protein
MDRKGNLHSHGKETHKFRNIRINYKYTNVSEKGWRKT